MISNEFYHLLKSFYGRKIENTIMEEKDYEFFKHLLIQWMEELLDHADQTLKDC